MGAGLRPGTKAPESPPDPNVGAPAPDSTRDRTVRRTEDQSLGRQRSGRGRRPVPHKQHRRQDSVYATTNAEHGSDQPRGEQRKRPGPGPRGRCHTGRSHNPAPDSAPCPIPCPAPCPAPVPRAKAVQSGRFGNSKMRHKHRTTQPGPARHGRRVHRQRARSAGEHGRRVRSLEGGGAKREPYSGPQPWEYVPSTDGSARRTQVTTHTPTAAPVRTTGRTRLQGEQRGPVAKPTGQGDRAARPSIRTEPTAQCATGREDGT